MGGRREVGMMMMMCPCCSVVYFGEGMKQ